MSLRAFNRAAAFIAAATLATLTGVTGCAIHPPATTASQTANPKSNPPAHHQTAISAGPSPPSIAAPTMEPSPRPVHTTPVTPAVPSPPWRPPTAAIAVAENYAVAALSFDWTHPAAITDRLRPLSTPQWAAQLDADADGGGGGQADLIAAHATIVAHPLAAYPSVGPGPGKRIEVTATVTVTVLGHTPATSPAAVAVDLLAQPDGRWLVAWSQ